MPFIQNQIDNFIYMRADTISANHAFTTRFGGVSENGLFSLNLGYNRGDEIEKVTENYRIIGEKLGMDTLNAGFTKQVHSAKVKLVTKDNTRHPHEPDGVDCDAVVTNVAGIPIFCFTADCVPVLLHDAKNHVAAAIHCGWRSSVADILKNTVDEMEKLGAVAENIHAAIGPAIDKCCFETDEDVIQALHEYLGDKATNFYTFDETRKKYMVDLKSANRERLISLGLLAENIAVSDECTMCLHEKYWSHRKTKGVDRGSQCAVIVL